ncbi:MAG: hypothetical protein GWP42_02310 [Verrucomicrobiales bacterium]|nr:hypothetical protein [Verrucomicrobiales bacterium]
MKSPSDIDNSSNPDLEGVVLLKDDGKKYLWDNPLNVKKFIKGFFLVCLVIFLFDFLFLFDVIHKHLSFKEGEFLYEGWVGFYCASVFVSCAMIVVVAKELRKVLMRGDDYYDK